MTDAYDLDRFVKAQEGAYRSAIAELRAGRKRTHWMWFVFPQFQGLGRSSISERYAIKSLDEARAYLSHPVLGPRLTECAEALLAFTGISASDIFGYPDDGPSIYFSIKFLNSIATVTGPIPPGTGV
jgi:uncharacterized protein (DUF1810 family)